jgi:dCMP deaminase
MSNKWDVRFMELAELVASWSKDPSTQCGAVIVDQERRVVSVGFNGFPRGTDDNPDMYVDRKIKYLRVQHAERNAILFARRGDLTGCTLYVWPMPPCAQCAGAIIQAGIFRVVTVEPTGEQMMRWNEDLWQTAEMFKEAGVTMEYIRERG